MGQNDHEHQIAYRTLVHNHQGDDLDLMNKRAGVLGTSEFKKKIKKLAAIIGFCLISLFSAFMPQSAWAQGFTVPAGTTLDIGAGTLNVVGDITIEGTLIATSGTINVTGDWINSTGTFVQGTSTVNLTGTSQSITGATTFYNLSKVTAADTLTFEAGKEQSIEGTLTLQGTSSAALLTLNGSGGSEFQLNLKTGATQDLRYFRCE